MRPIESNLKTIGTIVLIPLMWYGFFSFIYLSIYPNVWPIHARGFTALATITSWVVIFFKPKD